LIKKNLESHEGTEGTTEVLSASPQSRLGSTLKSN
jgi:hypothetical protein